MYYYVFFFAHKYVRKPKTDYVFIATNELCRVKSQPHNTRAQVFYCNKSNSRSGQAVQL